MSWWCLNGHRENSAHSGLKNEDVDVSHVVSGLEVRGSVAGLVV